MIDTHCHLTFPQYDHRVATVLEDASAAGVTGAISIATTHPDAGRALALAERYENVWCSAGVHPLYSHEGPHDWGELERVARHPKCVAWGELGLDNHYDNPSGEVQRTVLDEHLAVIAAALPEVDKPVVVHCREAYGELIPILRASGIRPERFVFHCFTSGPEDVQRCLDFGAMISFTGMVTFKNAQRTRDAARLVPLDRIMVETDSPFMTPEPYRKIRTCEPKYAATIAQRLAEVRGEPWEEFHAAINANTERFFGIRCG